MPEANDWNQTIIDEFRANAGKVGGHFEGAPILLLHHTGARSGRVRVNPMMYQAIGDDFAVFASKSGAPTNPDWYYNLLANPKAKIEVGTDTFDVVARVAEGEERERIWAIQGDPEGALSGLRGVRAEHRARDPGRHPRTSRLSFSPALRRWRSSSPRARRSSDGARGGRHEVSASPPDRVPAGPASTADAPPRVARPRASNRYSGALDRAQKEDRDGSRGGAGNRDA